MDTKRCTHCGEVRPIGEFRKYYKPGVKVGYYRYCKTCEKIMTRRRYLVGKGDRLTESERVELSKIEQLYDLREAAGLEVLGRGRQQKARGEAAAIVDQMLEDALKRSAEAQEN